MTKIDYQTIREIAEHGPDDISEIYQFPAHLIYSSPATLAFNSPGAEGYGVKRAGLAVPESIMLIVAPGCCGRNTSLISRIKGYDHRFFYLMMDETDLITGRHLTKIPEAVKDVVDTLGYKPSVVMICITCVDALLGTDMERVCRKAEDFAKVRVRPCYMYALTREGRKPPMVHVRESLYSLLEPKPKVATSINILGFFAPLRKTELLDVFYRSGIKTIRQIGTCQTYDEFLNMAEANFNLVINPEAYHAAKQIHKRLGIPFVSLERFYGIERIHHQYQAISNVFHKQLDDEEMYQKAKNAIQELKELQPLSVAVGECLNANPFELALSLVEYGCQVKAIYANVDPSHFAYINALNELSPETKVYSNMEPTMLYYDGGEDEVDLAIGKDAIYYHDQSAHLNWNEDMQPFGYQGLIDLIEAIKEAVK